MCFLGTACFHIQRIIMRYNSDFTTQVNYFFHEASLPTTCYIFPQTLTRMQKFTLKVHYSTFSVSVFFRVLGQSSSSYSGTQAEQRAESSGKCRGQADLSLNTNYECDLPQIPAETNVSTSKE